MLENKLGLLGSRIGYSLSPLIHKSSGKLLGRSTHYQVFDVSKHQVLDTLKACWDQGYAGLNITTPYKNYVARHFAPHRLDSVNTLYRGTNNWLAASTDGLGFLAALKRWRQLLEEFSQVIVLGNGGVVSSLLEAFAAQGLCCDIHIVRRSENKDKGFEFWESKGLRIFFHPWAKGSLQSLQQSCSGKTLLIQATSAPHRGDGLSGFSQAVQGFSGFFADLVYNPASDLYHSCCRMGIPCFDGVPMLIEQARAAQKLWWNEAADYTTMEQILRSHEHERAKAYCPK